MVMNANMDVPKIKTYSRKQPVVSYKTSSALVPSYPDPQMNVRESRLNEKTLIIDSFNDTFDQIIKAEKLRSEPLNKSKNDTVIDIDQSMNKFFKKPMFEKVKKVKKGKRRKDMLDNQENLTNEDLDKPKRKRQKNQLAKDKIKKPKQKVTKNVKKNILLKGIENLQLKECTVNLSKCSTGYNLCNSHEVLEVNSKQNSSNMIGEFNKSIDLNTFSQHLRPTDNLLSSTPRDHKPRMVVNVQNLSPITLHKDNRHNLKKRVSILEPGEKVKQSYASNVLKELTLKNVKNNSFDQVVNHVKPKKSILKVTTNIQSNSFENNSFDEMVNHEKPKKSILKVSFENNPGKRNVDDQNKIAEEMKDADKNNCSISELLDSKKLHNSIDNRTSHESLNPSNQHLIAQQNTNKQYLDENTMTNEKENKSENFVDSPLLFDETMDLIKLTNNMNSDIMKIVNSPLQKSVQKVDQDKVNTKSRIGSTVINESSFIPDDWTNDYTSTYEYGLQTENSNHDETENVELNKESITNNIANTSKGENINSKLFLELKESDENEKRSKLFENTEDDKHESAVLQDSINDSINKKSITNTIANTSKGENINSKLFLELKESDENEKRSKLFENIEDDKHESAVLQDSINDSINKTINQNSEPNDETITEETVKDFQEINKTDVLCDPISNDKNTRSGEHKGTKRKLDQTKEYTILNSKEPIIHIHKIDDVSLKKRKVHKKSNSKNTRQRTLSNKMNKKAKKDMNNENEITEFDKNNFKTDNKAVANKYNRHPVLKISKIENQNFKDISSVLPPQILEKLKNKLQKARVNTSKIEEQTEENHTEMLNNSALEKLNEGDQEAKRNVVAVNEINDSVNEDIDNSNDNPQDLNLLLSKLKDSTKITMRRKTIKKRDKPLAAITEDQADESFNSLTNKETRDKTENKNMEMQNPCSNKSLHDDFLAEENEINKSTCDRQKQLIFLKPGKSWSRSLSIINHFYDLNGQNLEELAVGRGKNWRDSVQSVLDMQPEGTLHNLSNNDEERDFHLHSLSTRVSTRRETNPFSLVSTSPSRVSRFSMRIIPDGKRSTLTDDFVTSQRSSTISNLSRKRSLRKASLKIRRDTLIETEEDLIRSAKDIIFKRCKQNSYLPFDVCFPDSYIDNCSKIGEGVYGEVFLHVSDEGKKSVIKIIPIEGDELVNCEPQKKFHEILSEIIIAEELYKLRFGDECNTNGFVGVNKIMCVIGKYPQKLIDLWDIYDIKKKSENDCPSMFKDGQLYIIFELAHGGQDLESFVFQNASESFSIFLQTALTLAVAEKSLEFEHRDLHWGNILISKTDETESTYKLEDNEFSLPTKGVKVSVIDFTLSRMSYQGCKIFNDLATDPSLFAAQGEYQFEIYRLMRNAVNNDWQQFNPYTNVLWLDYTLDKMISGARYKKKTTKIHKTAIQEMKDLRKEILNYKSAYDFIKNCNIVGDRISI